MSDTRCSYCTRGFCLTVRKTKDHLIPRKKFGVDDMVNIVYACEECNHWKGAKTLEEFLATIRRLLYHNKPIRPPYNDHLLRCMVKSIKELVVYAEANKSKLSHYKIKK